MKKNAAQMQEAVEQLIDENDLYEVVEALESVSHGKREHIQTNWPDDKALAETWKIAGNTLGKALLRIGALKNPAINSR